jgi:3',5'-cyclic AMP phosphodiesterase CpdA
VALVAVNSARPNPQPWRSSGAIPPAQLAALVKVLADDRVRDRFVFVITHYAPRLANGKPDKLMHGLDNADELLSICADLPRGAILHGHVHRCFRVRVPGVRPAMFGAGSTTQDGREGLWLFEIGANSTATRGTWATDRYVLTEERHSL